MLHQSAQIPLARRRLDWLEMHFANPPEWISPYFVRELRALLRPAQFGIPLMILVAGSWFLTFRALVDTSFEGRGISLTSMQILLIVFVVDVTPFIVLSEFQMGHNQEQELIQLLPRSGIATVMGKLWAACAVNLLYVLATLPFVVTASMVCGAALAGSVGMIVFAICVGIAQAELAILGGSVSNPSTRIVTILVLVVSGFFWTIGIALLNGRIDLGIVFLWLQSTFLFFAHGIVVSWLQHTRPYLMPVPFEPDWALMVAGVARRFTAAIAVIDETSPEKSVAEESQAAMREQAVRAAAQQLAWVLNPGSNLWSGLGCRCAMSPSLKRVADEVAFAAQQVFARIGCLEPLLLRDLLDAPLWTGTPPVLPKDEIVRLRRAIDELQAWGDRRMHS